MRVIIYLADSARLQDSQLPFKPMTLSGNKWVKCLAVELCIIDPSRRIRLLSCRSYCHLTICLELNWFIHFIGHIVFRIKMIFPD